ncbi:GABA permease [Marinithermofilum abyssi]|uniref:GABA permease n=1 Tax=Marinithermofilum abyssi TaxID=1571185 RepID=A0A8J2VJL3_9BACL|nr:amino acid permease [Marinithermofilum abyssi]GGE24552.1 GABA permease [Marinithermofilum abyssi]
MKEKQVELKRDLKIRHLMMIAYGGTIGAGLFVGSGSMIHAVGPASVLSYLMAGILVVLVMRMLGEMAAVHPSVGSFSEYARLALGNWAGFSVGWLYWYFWVIAVSAQTIAAARILKTWFPSVPLWGISLGIILLLILTNAASVRFFGRFQYWVSMIKVTAIILFILAGLVFVFGWWPGTELSFVNLTAHGGFAPNGLTVIFQGAIIAIFSFVGVEIVTIASAESKTMARTVAKTTNTVTWWVLFFYIGSIFLVVTILPWNDGAVLKSPYVSVLKELGIPEGALIMNGIVLTALVSGSNSGLYASSRMLYALAKYGDAPAWCLSLTRRGVPFSSVLAGAFAAFLSVVSSYVSPDQVFLFLVHSSGAIALFIYLLISISQLRMRGILERENPRRLKVRVWGFPYVTYAMIVLMIVVISSMLVMPDMRIQLILGFVTWAAVLAVYGIRLLLYRKMQKKRSLLPSDMR